MVWCRHIYIWCEIVMFVKAAHVVTHGEKCFPCRHKKKHRQKTGRQQVQQEGMAGMQAGSARQGEIPYTGKDRQAGSVAVWHGRPAFLHGTRLPESCPSSPNHHHHHHPPP